MSVDVTRFTLVAQVPGPLRRATARPADVVQPGAGSRIHSRRQMFANAGSTPARSFDNARVTFDSPAGRSYAITSARYLRATSSSRSTSFKAVRLAPRHHRIHDCTKVDLEFRDSSGTIFS